MGYLYCNLYAFSFPAPDWFHTCFIKDKRILDFVFPFYLGPVYAVALRDIFAQARNHDNFPPVLQHEEPEWEKHRSVNMLEFIDIYRWDTIFSLQWNLWIIQS